MLGRPRLDLIMFNVITRTSTGVFDASNANLVLCNNFAGNWFGVETLGFATRVFWNNFFRADSATNLFPPNSYTQPKPTGGNYWSVHAPQCIDVLPADGFCDAPYRFNWNQDWLPHIRPILWPLNPVAYVIASSPRAESVEP